MSIFERFIIEQIKMFTYYFVTNTGTFDSHMCLKRVTLEGWLVPADRKIKLRRPWVGPPSSAAGAGVTAATPSYREIMGNIFPTLIIFV